MQRLALPRHIVLLLSVLASAALHASPLDIGAQQRFRAATCEVVQKMAPKLELLKKSFKVLEQ